MCKTQCFLALIALSINLVNSWDIAITSGDQLEFYSNSNKTGNEGARFRDLTALAYDAVNNMLLFVDRQNDNASIFSYHLATKKYQPLVRRKSFENIQGIAFDPVQSLLFWTDTNERSIYWISLKPGFKNNVYGNLLIKMDYEIPRAIAVDSCRGYIYWTNTNTTKATIERSRFDGKGREIIISDQIDLPVSIAVDQQTKRLYWVDDKEGINFSIESSDLNGTQASRKTLHVGNSHFPNALTVSNDSVYWVDWGYKSVWKLPKVDYEGQDPKEMLKFSNKPFGIVANYQVEDQTRGVTECSNLLSLSQNSSAINSTFSIPKDVGLFCLHGVKVEGKPICNCSPGYIGERCEITVCQNYCLQGDCTLEADGQPICRCQKGFTGARCETELCNGHCLNNGVCSIDDSQTPVCTCSGDYSGPRCDTFNPPVETTTIAIPVNEPCNCTKEVTKLSAETPRLATSDEFVTSCNDGWDSVRDPILMVLGTLCGLLCLVCAVLITKILHLKKRPRIKKRIIVNKNVTPLTARPDQCEITIENCCNMNICETSMMTSQHIDSVKDTNEQFPSFSSQTLAAFDEPFGYSQDMDAYLQYQNRCINQIQNPSLENSPKKPKIKKRAVQIKTDIGLNSHVIKKAKKGKRLIKISIANLESQQDADDLMAVQFVIEDNYDELLSATESLVDRIVRRLSNVSY